MHPRPLGTFFRRPRFFSALISRLQLNSPSEPAVSAKGTLTPVRCARELIAGPGALSGADQIIMWRRPLNCIRHCCYVIFVSGSVLLLLMVATLRIRNIGNRHEGIYVNVERPECLWRFNAESIFGCIHLHLNRFAYLPGNDNSASALSSADATVSWTYKKGTHGERPPRWSAFESTTKTSRAAIMAGQMRTGPSSSLSGSS